MGRRGYRKDMSMARNLAKKEQDFSYGEEALAKIGSSMDDSTISSGYNYKLVRPYYKSRIVIPKKFQRNGTLSLKVLAAMKLARNCLSLSPSHLQIGAWQTWSEVWDLILINEFDSPYVFNMFAQQFATNQFPVHLHLKPQRGEVNSKRNEIILAKTLRNKNHRLETLSWSSKEFPQCLHHKSFHNLAILDLSSLKGTQVARTKKFYIELTNLRTLAFLNCNGLSDIDNSICTSWVMSIKLGKWPLLKAICLKDATIEPEGYQQLMSLQNSQLYYIETSVKLRELKKNWEPVALSDLIKHDTSLKYYYIERNLKPAFLRTEAPHILMDFKVIENEIILKNNELPSNDRMNHFLEKIWQKRSQRGLQSSRHYSYCLKEKPIDKELQPIPITIQKHKKPKLINVTSHKSFFDL